MGNATTDRQAPKRGAKGEEGLDARRRHQRKEFVRLCLTYLGPVLFLTVFFLLQHHWITDESRRLHLLSIAETQANTLDLFLRERVADVSNLLHDPSLRLPPTSETLARGLAGLKQDSDSFADVGFFDASGEQVAYAGPFPSLEHKNYGKEAWFAKLKEQVEDFIITDIYLGFRDKPHFTVAVKRIVDGQYYVMRATLDPQEIYEYVTTLQESSGVATYIVNRGGGCQLAPAQMAEVIDESFTVPPSSPTTGTHPDGGAAMPGPYAYSWLRTADWALIVRIPSTTAADLLSAGFLRILAISMCTILIVLCVIWVRSKKLVQFREKTEQAEAQLEHAAKLASVGELAAGIAHEINNPLAVITEEAGLAKDLISQEFEDQITLPEVVPFLERIEEAAFRCRDITRKLLQFVRRTEVDLREQDIHDLIDEVADGLLGRELAVSNVEIVKDYARDLPAVTTDKSQLQQVLLNLLNNAVDALNGPGRITIATTVRDGHLRLSVSDTGRGMTPEHMERIFQPFFTTKEVGQGTGLGLSVSYAIVKGMGGRIDVKSAPNEGSTFTIVIPIR
ncbi:MAG: ATP-binding protein [Planctomycetota bacterium]